MDDIDVIPGMEHAVGLGRLRIDDEDIVHHGGNERDVKIEGLPPPEEKDRERRLGKGKLLGYLAGSRAMKEERRKTMNMPPEQIRAALEQEREKERLQWERERLQWEREKLEREKEREREKEIIREKERERLRERELERGRERERERPRYGRQAPSAARHAY